MAGTIFTPEEREERRKRSEYIQSLPEEERHRRFLKSRSKDNYVPFQNNYEYTPQDKPKEK